MKSRRNNLLQKCRLLLRETRASMGAVLDAREESLRRANADAAVLEQRLLMSAVPAAAAVAAPVDSVGEVVAELQSQQVQTTAESDAAATQDGEAQSESAVELIFIDGTVAGAEDLANRISEDATSRTKVITLQPGESALTQMTQVLAEHSEIAGVHVVSHGDAGQIRLGRDLIDLNSIEHHAETFRTWSRSISADADLLFYGCDVAAVPEGRLLLDRIAELTGADTAASTDATGHSRYGGNWTLEFSTGAIETNSLSGSAVDQWQGKLAHIQVTTTADVIDAGDGVISLREAVIQANSGAGGDTIELGAGVYTLSIGPDGDDSADFGDLDLRVSMTITGAGAGQTFIDGGGIDRVFHLKGSGVAVSMSDLSIQNGFTDSSGAAIRSDNNTSITLTDVVLSGNTSGDNGGALEISEVAVLERVLITGNSAVRGGGLYIAGGTPVTLTNVTISGNTASSDGGGIWVSSNVSVVSSTIAFNSSTAGAGIHLSGGGTAQLTNTILHNPGYLNTNKTLTSNGGNLDSDGTAGLAATKDQSGVDPLLDPLADNGGPFQTHALTSSSPAIDGGITTGIPATDARGFGRSGDPDIGAFEYRQLATMDSEIVVNETRTDTQQTIGAQRGSQQAVASQTNGGFVVVWSSLNQDAAGWEVYARCFNPDGTPVGNEFRINETLGDDQVNAKVASDAAGNFVVTWQSSDQDGTADSVYARRYAADGTALSGEFRVNSHSSGSQSAPDIAMNDSGQFVIVWQGNGPAGEQGIFARRFDASGTALDAAEFRVTENDSSTQGQASVSLRSDGSFAVAWKDDDKIYARLIAANRSFLTNHVRVDIGGIASTPDVVWFKSGEFLVAFRSDTVFFSGIYARRFDQTGAALTSSLSVEFGDAHNPSLSGESNGQVMLTWHGSGDGDGYGIRGGRISAGNAWPDSVMDINTVTTGAQQYSSSALANDGELVVVWTGPASGYSDDIYARTILLPSAGAPVVDADQSFTVAEDDPNGSLIGILQASGASWFQDWTIVSGNESGAFALNPSNGRLTVADAGLLDNDGQRYYSLVITVSDGFADSPEQRVVVQVTEQDHAPVAVDDSYAVNEGGSLNVPVTAGWWNTAWQNRRDIIFDNSAGITNLTDEVVAIRLHESAADAVTIDYAKTQNGGEDLRFTDAAGNLLAHQVEDWDESGYSVVWVRVPQINAGSNTDLIRMYYNNPVVSHGNSSELLWEDDARAVLHMTGNALDSTSYQNNGIVSNAAASPGYFGGAAYLNGGSGQIDLASDSSLDDLFAGGGTLSAWINPTGWGEGDQGRIADKASGGFGGSNADGWTFRVGGSGADGFLRFSHGFTGSAGQWRTATGSLQLNSWQHVAVVFDSTSDSNVPKLFINGVEQALTQISAASGTARSDAAEHLRIGNRSGDASTFAGRIDEVNIVQTAHSSSYIGDRYRILSGGFVSGGSEETVQAGVLTNDSDENGDPLTVQLVSGPDFAASFTLNADGSFSYTHDGSNTTTDSFTYRISDGSSTSDATVTLNVNPDNDTAPVITGGQSFTVSESATNGTSVGIVTATDADGATTFSNWQIVSGNASGIFTINTSTGAITIADGSALDFESTPSHTLSVTVSDGVNTSTATDVTVTVSNENDTAPVITGGQSFSVSESAANGTSVGTVSATDADGATTFSNWQIVSGNASGIFTINTSTGAITIADGSALDFETTPSHTLSITVSDGVNTSASTDATVTVTNENDTAPVITGGQSFTISESATNGTSVGTVTATDADGATTFSNWQIVSGNASGIFTINTSTGAITIADGSALDFETTPSHTLSITVSDGVNTSASTDVTVTVTNENDTAPVITGGQSFTISESATNGTSVGTVSATDADGATTFSNWQIVSGNASGIFTINTSTGAITIADGSGLDFETTPSHTLSITVSDGVNTSASTDVTVTVTNENDTAPVITGVQSFTVSESATNGTSVGTVSATDADGATTFSNWQIVSGNASGIFTINTSTGAITIADGSALDFETTPSHTLSITVSDGVNTSAATDVTVTVTNENDTAPVITGGQSFTISESATNGTSVGTVTATDADGATTFSNWQIVSGNASGIFTINTSTGAITIADGSALDFETTPSHTLSITVSDGVNTSTATDVTVTVTNENDTAPVITGGQSFTISESATNGTNVGTVSATDADGATTFSNWQIVSGNASGIFTINTSTGAITIADGSALDFETTPGHTLSVTVSDGVNTSTATDVTVTVTNENESPQGGFITLSSPSEGDALTAEVSGVTDPESDALVYEWDIDNDGVFDDGIGNRVTLTWDALGALTNPIRDDGNYNVHVRATDPGGLSVTSAGTFAVANKAPEFTLTGPSAVDSGELFSVALSVTDPGDDSLIQWSVDWGDGTVDLIAGSTRTAEHVYTQPGLTHLVNVSVTDEDGAYTTPTHDLTVSVRNTAPSGLTLSNTIVDEAQPGATIGTLSFADADAGDSHTFAVSDSRFEIVGSELRLKSGISLDRSVTASVDVSVTVTDSVGATVSEIFTIEVNGSPDALDDAFSVTGATGLTITDPVEGVLGNDSDPEGDSLTALLLSGPSHAESFSLNSDGTFSYVPVHGAAAGDSFTYVVTDGRLQSAPATVFLSVNQQPTLSLSGAVTVLPENTSTALPIQLASGIVSDDGIGTHVLSLSGRDASAFTVTSDGRLLLNSGVVLDHETKAELQVLIELDDPALGTASEDSALFTLRIADVNERPSASSISELVFPEDSSTVSRDVSGSFSDPDAADVLRWSVAFGPGSTGLLQEVRISSTGVLSVTPASDRHGSAAVLVTASDSGGLSVTESVPVRVTPVNDAPTASDVLISVTSDTATPILPSSLLAGASDVDGDVLHLVLLGTPANGTLTTTTGGGLSYQPYRGFSGTDTFTIAASDGVLQSAPATATINVISAVTPGTPVTTPVVSDSSGSDSSSEQTTSSSEPAPEVADTSVSPTPPLTATGNPTVRVSQSDDDDGDDGLVPAAKRPEDSTTATVAEDAEGYIDTAGIQRVLGTRLRSGTDRTQLGGSFNAVIPTSAEAQRLALAAERTRFLQQMRHGGIIWNQLDALEQQTNERLNFGRAVYGTVGIVSSGLAVGTIVWAVRGGLLLSGLIAQMPAWSMLDPLLVVDGLRGADDDDSLEDIADQQRQRLDSLPSVPGDGNA